MVVDSIPSVFVALYSCNAYLQSRANDCWNSCQRAEAREKDFVGKKNKEHKNKKPASLEFLDFVTELQAEDDYESLPQKSLALIEWFLKNSTADYLFKIDDDCLLHEEVSPHY